MQLKFLY